MTLGQDVLGLAGRILDLLQLLEHFPLIAPVNPPQNKGLSQIKAATQTLGLADLPDHWEDNIEVVTRKRTKERMVKRLTTADTPALLPSARNRDRYTSTRTADLPRTRRRGSRNAAKLETVSPC
jgi:hypothetical protein